MVVRRDVNVEAIGQMAQLPPDLSPLQLGAKGEFAGQGFTLIGRVRRGYDEGSWNEWCALFGDQQFGWVAEAQGFFMVSFEVAPPDGFPAQADAMAVDSKWQIGEQTFTVVDRKENTCIASEGELPFVASPNRSAMTVDLSGDEAAFASVEFSDTGTRLFVGRYARFDDLKFSGLRPVPGWSEDALEPKPDETTSLKCPNCGGVVDLHAAGFTMSATCGSCGALIDTSTPELRLIQQWQERQKIKPAIPIGSRGVLFGVNYEVIGFQHVKDNYSGWLEYLLFNPWQGFVWLVSYNGHWSFVRRLFEQPKVTEGIFSGSAAHVKFGSETYRVFAASDVTTDYVLGEFYWKVQVGMKTLVTDFVAPPFILSRESYPGLAEQTWSQGEYVEHEVIEKAFNLAQPLREPTGTYLNQPNPYAAKGRQLAWLVPLILVALLVMQVLSARHAAHERVLNATYNYQAGLTNAPVVTQPFEVAGSRQALEYDLSAPVDNNWMELDIDLVNVETHQVAATSEQGIEYYHGYDDGYWSEGSTVSKILVPAVPPGKYYLTVESSADPAISAMPFTVAVVRDVMVWSNFWIALVLVLAYPLYCWLRAYTFERARWLESDFTPSIYKSQSDDDD